ncbi:MAG: membrane protein insertion efficiency factor YidD [Nitrospirota bacterium]|jgi:putative membrane protein insertion efficiency factor
MLPIKKAILFSIDLYRAALSPLLPASCRFTPTCSCYAREAVERHGARRGLALAAKRILKCHPLHPGGYDPVR